MVGPADRQRRRRWRLFVTLTAAGVCAFVGVTIIMCANSIRQVDHDLPNATLTPGDAISGLTAEQVCVPGYARSVRDVPVAIRKQVFMAYGLAGNHTGYCASQEGCELDHLISLSLGGSNDPKNLWPESYDGSSPWTAHVKDRLEDRLHAMVCSHQISLEKAQQALANDWVSSFKVFVSPAP
jgi:hypothetical protein